MTIISPIAPIIAANASGWHAYFVARPGRVIPLEELRTQHVALTLFTPEAFQYFLPAFMLVSLDKYEKGDLIPDAIRFYFEYSQEARGHFAVRMSKFSPAQRKVIIDYLIHMERKGAGSSEHAIGMLTEESAYV